MFCGQLCCHAQILMKVFLNVLSFFKDFGRFPNALIITLSPATFVPIYDVTLLFNFFFILWEHQ